MASPAKSSSKESDTSDPTLDKVLKAYRASRKYTEGGFWDTWSACWKLYNNKRVQIGYDGFTEVFIPETYTEIQGIKAHLVNGPNDGSNIEISFLPTHPDQKGDTNLAQDLFNYAWNKDNMSQKVDAAITEYLVTGNAYIWSSVGEDGLPCQRVVSAKDCWFDVHATNYENLTKGGYRYLTTLDELKKATVVNGSYNEDDPDSGEPSVPRYQNLDKIGEYNEDSDDKFAKEEREEMLAGSLLEDKTDVVECIIAFMDDRMITIANRHTVIEDVPTPFQREKKTVQSHDDQGNAVSFDIPEIEPFIPVAPFRNLVDPNLWYARGDVEMIAESQERLNDVQAQKSDNLTFQLNRMWALDPNFAQKIDEIQSVPGAVFTIPPGALEQIQTLPMGADADVEIARLKAEMQGATGSNELMAGTQMVRGGRTSMYQINAELIMLGARFRVKVSNLETEAFKILVANMWKIMQIYIDKEISVRVEGPNGPSFAQYNPGLFLGDWDFNIKLGVTADAKKQTEMQQAMQFYLLASKLPFINQQGLFAMIATTMFDKTVREVENLIEPPQPPEQPSIVPKLIETFKPEDLYPDEQGQILSEAGIQPSPLREEAAGTALPPANPSAAALHAKIIHTPKDKGHAQDFGQSNSQVATAPAEGTPPASSPQVANIPRMPNS